MNEKNMETVVEEIHRPARRNYQRRHVDIRDIDETWQGDLVDMSAYSTENKGFKFLLTVIDIFSKYAWAIPIKSKKGVDVSNAMESIFKQGRIPKNLHVDKGTEFYNSTFQNLMMKYNINLYSTYSNLKASICERFNRTLKRKMWMKFSLQGSYKWIDIIQDLVDSYNNTKHRTIKTSPINVTPANSRQIYRNIYNQLEAHSRFGKMKFNVNDKVRVSKFKTCFEKSYTPNFSAEIFTIKHINNTDPVTYLLEDYQNNPIKGCFYEAELTKVKILIYIL